MNQRRKLHIKGGRAGNHSQQNPGKKGSKMPLLAGMVAAGAALGYYFYGPHGEKNRKKVRGWMVQAKGDVLDELEKMKDVSQEKYNDTVDKVTKKYGKLSNISGKEAAKLGDELKKHWKNIKKEVTEDAAPKKKRSTKKKAASKKATKKTTKKATTKKRSAK